ncbi:MAG TPA: sigma-70 family RNA polymerase sigma factor [Polyangiaceae bacterium]|nr:sigma-70 family RNA polymerase sigma factor [Polyangiaceae bacterium]
MSTSGALRSLPSGDSAVFYASIYRQHFAFVWRSLRRLGVADAELSDGAQEVFLVVFRKLPELDRQSRLSTWLYAVCLRVASDWRRRGHRRYEVLAEEPVPQPTSEVTDTSDLRGLLAQALQAMPLEQRAVFSAFELEGMSGEQIAEALGVPLATVHSRLRLAREKFRSVVTRERAREGKPLAGAKEAL